MSEIFPMEIRAQAIALFLAIAQCFGAFGPWFYGQLIGGLAEVFLGIDAEGKSLEDVATPLSVVPQPVAA